MDGREETMTPEEFTEKMRFIAVEYGDDEEAAHGRADDLLMEALEALGYEAGVKVFRQMDKWYA